MSEEQQATNRDWPHHQGVTEAEFVEFVRDQPAAEKKGIKIYHLSIEQIQRLELLSPTFFPSSSLAVGQRWVLYLGTVLEYFDMYLFIHMASTLAKLYFSANDKWAVICQSLLASITWLLRIFGGYWWGKKGDREGRIKVLSRSLWLMAAVSWGIALLPTYEKIGILASVLIVGLRFLQGYAGYGEFLGSVVYLTEKSGKDKDKHISYIFFSTVFGGGFLAIFVMNFAINNLNFIQIEWWRVVYAISGFLALLGWYIRKKFHETATLYKSYDNQSKEINYIKTLKSVGWRKGLAWASMDSIGAFGFLFIFVFLPFFLRKYYGYSDKDIIAHNQYLYVIECIGLLLWITIFSNSRTNKESNSLQLLIYRCAIALTIFSVFLYMYTIGNQEMSLKQIIFFQSILLCFFPCPGFGLGTLVSKLDDNLRMTQYGALSGVSRLVIGVLGLGLPFIMDLPPRVALSWGIFVYIILTIMAMFGFHHLKRYPDLIELERIRKHEAMCDEKIAEIKLTKLHGYKTQVKFWEQYKQEGPDWLGNKDKPTFKEFWSLKFLMR